MGRDDRAATRRIVEDVGYGHGFLGEKALVEAHVEHLPQTEDGVDGNASCLHDLATAFLPIYEEDEDREESVGEGATEAELHRGQGQDIVADDDAVSGLGHGRRLDEREVPLGVLRELEVAG